jgi:hypothetical protein
LPDRSKWWTLLIASSKSEADMKLSSLFCATVPKIKPRVRSGPINGTLLAASTLAAIALVSKPAGTGEILQWGAHGLSALASAALYLKGIKLLVKDFRLRSDLAISQRVTSDHGTAPRGNA